MALSLGAADLLRPFHLERSQLRGRAIRLGSTIDQVLGAHDYPLPVSALLGELLVLTAALAGGLKFSGTFSLQVRGDGPVRLLVADCTNDGQMRGYASFDAGQMEGAGSVSPVTLLGKAVMALTVDQREAGGELYQGIVELEGATIAESMCGYFRRSEQVPTGIRAAVGQEPLTGRWQAGAVMVQAMPGSRPEDGEEAQESWHEAMLLLHTATDEELLNPGLSLDTLLFRLFHEDGVRVFEPQRLHFGCGCSEERVRGVLRRFSAEDVAEMREEDGGISVTCQFCSRRYRFKADQVDEIIETRLH